MAGQPTMIARQKALADFGELALRSEHLDEILGEACAIVAEALDADLAKVLEIQEGGNFFLVRAGIGWKPGIVGEMRLPMSERSSETYAINEACPVVSNNIHKEERFEYAGFLKDHGVMALINVPIFLPGGKPYGLLQVDSRQPREFGDDSIAFLRTYTSILGPVIDRLHKSHSLEQALSENKQLLQELQHRIKNHIGIIMSFVSIRIRRTHSEEARAELEAIGDRIETLRLLHEQLYAGRANQLELPVFMRTLAENLCRLYAAQSGEIHLSCDLQEVTAAPELALPVGLIVNEFVTNSLKHAFNGSGGTIVMTLTETDGICRLAICDSGKGMPTRLQPEQSGSGTGIKLIEGLARQIGAQYFWSGAGGGTQLRLEFSGRSQRAHAPEELSNRI